MSLQFDFSLDEKLLAPFAGMSDGQLRKGEGFRRDCPEGLFIAESARVIERALDKDLEPLCVLVETHWLKHDSGIIERMLTRNPDLPVFVVSAPQFSEITGYQVVRGALACFKRPPALGISDVIENARRVVLLEDITNYANMGAVFRSAAALGWDAVILSPSCHDPYYRRCARVSMGAVFQIPWIHLTDKSLWPQSAISYLQDQGFFVSALALDPDAWSLRDPRVQECNRLAVMLGTEGEGLTPAAITACDSTLYIPMKHGVDSLNVAAAAAIALWELV